MAKIYATGNENLGDFNISYYIVEKSSDFLDWLSKLLKEVLDFKGDIKTIEEFLGDDDQGIPQYKYYLKDIKKMIDVHEKYGDGSDENRIDVFYGKKRVFLVFRKNKEMRKKFARFVMKTKDWIEVEEYKGKKLSLPAYAGKEI